MASKKKISPIKRGALSGEEKKLIEEWIDLKSDEDIARDLKRALKQVQEYKKLYLSSSPAIKAKRSEVEEYRRELRARPEWTQIQDEFSESELIYFENDYILVKQQFRELVHTEFKQVKQLITIDVLMHRHMTDRKRSQEEIERLEKILKREYDKPAAQQDINVITQLETNLQANRAASSQKTKEYKDLQEKHQALMKDLKATRDQRTKNLDQKGKFLDVLKMLTDEDSRRLINEEVGLYKLGVEVEKKRLSQLHKYKDGVVDRALLTPETVDGY
jgi:hypothetical protein